MTRVPPDAFSLHVDETRVAAARRATPSPARAIVLSAAIAVMLVLIGTRVGLHSDDWAHVLALRGAPAFPAQSADPLRLFSFADGDPATSLEAMNRGVLPWWTQPDLRMRFFRPLAAMSHALDHRVFADRPWAIQVHNLLWLVAVIVAAGLAYHRMAGAPSIAALAILMFAIDDAHAGAVAWMSGRNGLISAALAILALAAHDAWRRGGSRAGGVAAPLLLAGALLGGETAVGIGGYFLAHALFLDPGNWKARVAALAPATVVAVAWRLAYTGLGFGAFGSATYIDPAREPLRFFGEAVVRLPVQILAVWGLPYCEIYEQLSQPAARVMWSAALGVCALVLLALLPRLVRDARVRFWSLGMVLATVPNCATIPADRVLILVGFGAHALVATLLLDALRDLRAAGLGRVRRTATVAGVIALAGVHLVAAPVLLPVRCAAERHGRLFGERFLATLPDDPALRARHLVAVNGLGAWSGPLVRLAREYHDLPVPDRMTTLASAFRAVEVTRADDRTLLVRPVGGFLVPSRTPLSDDPQKVKALDLAYRLQQSDLAFRENSRSMPIGHEVRLDGVTLRVTELTADGRPGQIAATFDEALESPRWLWMRWNGATLVEFDPPAIGRSVVLAPGI